MADKLATAVIEFVTDGAKFFKGTDDIDARLGKLKGSFGSLGKEMLSAFALPVTAAGAVALIGKMGAEALEAADSIDKMAKASGNSAEQIQRMKFVSSQTSVEVEALAASSYKLGLRVAQGNKEAANGAKALGLEFEALKRASPDERMNTVMKALEGVEDATERNRIGTLLYGKAFKDIAPAVEGYTKSMGEAQVATNEQIAALDRAGDAIARVKAKIANFGTMTFGGIAQGILNLSDTFTGAQAPLESLTAAERAHYDAISSLVPGMGALQRQAFLVAVQQHREAEAHDAAVAAKKGNTAATATYTAQLKEAMKEIAGMTAAEKAQGDAATKLGAKEEEIAAAYGISEGALKIYTAQMREHNAEMKKAEKAGTMWGEGLSVLDHIEMDYNLTLERTDQGAAAAADAMAELGDAIARTEGNIIHIGPPTEAMLKQLDKMQERGTRLPSEGLLGAPIDTTLPPPPSKFSGWTSAVTGWAGDLPALIARSFEGGGGWAGALQAGTSTLGAGLMQKLGGTMGKDGKVAGGIVNGMGGLFGSLVSSAFPVIGALAGPLIGKLLGHFNKPEFQKIAKDVGKQWGVSISDGLAQQIEKDAKNFGKDRVAGELFNLSGIIGEAGGLNAGNLGAFTGKLRDVFSMIETGKFKAADAAKVLDANWSAFVAAHTDGNGRISSSLKEIIALADRFGVKSKEIAEWQKGQGANAITGFNAVVSAAAGSTRRELENLETQAVASYNAAVKAGMGQGQALEQLGPSIDAIRAKWKELGLESDNAAFAALDSARAMAQSNPALISGVEGLKQQMIALSNLGALDANTFAAMGETAALMYTRLQAEAEKLGKTGAEGSQAALAPMQGYLQAAAAQAKELGIPLDANTQELIRQSQELGLWKEAGLSATEKQTIALDKLTATMQAFSDMVGSVFDKAAGNPFAGWQVPAGLPALPGGGVPNVAFGGEQAEGGDYYVKKPTVFIAGDRGPENVKFTPGGRTDPGGGGGAGLAVSINAPMHVAGSVIEERRLAQTMLERFNDGGDVYQALERLVQTLLNQRLAQMGRA